MEKSSTVEHSWLNQSIQTASDTPISFSKIVCHSRRTQPEREKKRERKRKMLALPGFLSLP